MTILNVTAANIADIKAAKPGDTVIGTGALPAFRTGTWPLGVLAGVIFDLTAATITGWDLGNVSKLTFLGGALVANDTGPALQVTGGKGLVFKGQSGKGSVLGHGYVLSLESCEDVTIEGLIADGVRTGCKFGKLTRATVSGCEFRNMGSDGINMAGCHEIDIHHNAFHMFTPQPGAHPDAVQCDTPTDRYGRCSKITVRDNTIVGICQGMLLRGVDGVIVARNRIHVGEPTAIGVQDCTDVLIDDNGELRTLPSALYQAHIDSRGSLPVFAGANSAPKFRNTAATIYSVPPVVSVDLAALRAQLAATEASVARLTADLGAANGNVATLQAALDAGILDTATLQAALDATTLNVATLQAGLDAAVLSAASLRGVLTQIAELARAA